MALRVMTYNILKGGIGRQQSIQDVIQATDPDILVLQEVTDQKILQSLAQALQMQWFWGNGNQKTKVALLSKLPVMSFKSHHPRFPIWHNVIEAEVQYQPDRSFFLIGVHLIPHLWIGFELWRYFEVKYVISRCTPFPGRPLLVAGDFNAISPGDELMRRSSPASIKAMLALQANLVFRFAIRTLLAAGFRDSFRSLRSYEGGFTYPTPQPTTRFDYVFIDTQMQKYLKNCRVVREPAGVTAASDHYPVVAEFDLNT